MRRMLSGVAVAAALFLGAETAQAQRTVGVGISAGLAVPMGDLGDTHKAGWNATVSLNYHVPASSAGFRFEGFYNEFGRDEDRLVPLTGDMRIAGGSVSALYHLSAGAIRPYVIGGVGAYNSKLKGGEDAETNFGFNAGAGVKFVVGGLSTFAEARLHTISADGDQSRQFIPIVFGVEF